MSSKPTFFFSHARLDRETGNYLDQFFKDLEARLAQKVGEDDVSFGTIDRELLQGDDWDTNLSLALGTNKVFLAIMSPTFFKRESCGKELFGFLIRSPNLGIDSNGALMNAQNVFLIRWLREEYYYKNTKQDGLIPQLLGRINWLPADDGSDQELTNAIKRYRRSGLEQMVSSGGESYLQILISLVLRMTSIQDLPPSHPGFADLKDAFKYDWRAHFSSRGVAPSPAPAPGVTPPVEPRGLKSVVAFYVTGQEFAAEPEPVDFADQLIAEPLPGEAEPRDAEFAALLADVRAAGVAEGLTVFHAASNPAIPTNLDQLINRLKALSETLVLTAVVVDPRVWPGMDELEPGAAVVEEIIRSSKWIGPVLVPASGGRVFDVDKLVKTLDLPPRLVALPPESNARVAALRRAFVDTRGRALRSITIGGGSANESLPGLQGPVAEGA